MLLFDYIVYINNFNPDFQTFDFCLPSYNPFNYRNLLIKYLISVLLIIHNIIIEAPFLPPTLWYHMLVLHVVQIKPLQNIYRTHLNISVYEEHRFHFMKPQP